MTQPTDGSDILGVISSVKQIGNERYYRGDEKVHVYKSMCGMSYRYVFLVDGKIVSCVQVVTKDGKTAQAARAFTKADLRGMGLATGLLRWAKSDFETVLPATDLSDDGRRWTEYNWPETVHKDA